MATHTQYHRFTIHPSIKRNRRDTIAVNVITAATTMITAIPSQIQTQTQIAAVIVHSVNIATIIITTIIIVIAIARLDTEKPKSNTVSLMRLSLRACP
jgi:hypothetical protein